MTERSLNTKMDQKIKTEAQVSAMKISNPYSVRVKRMVVWTQASAPKPAHETMRLVHSAPNAPRFGSVTKTTPRQDRIAA